MVSLRTVTIYTELKVAGWAIGTRKQRRVGLVYMYMPSRQAWQRSTVHRGLLVRKRASGPPLLLAGSPFEATFPGTALIKFLKFIREIKKLQQN
jgi:hypothetical protein